MTPPTSTIATFPAPLTLPLRVLPLAPLSLSMTALTRSIARRHPGLFRRLGPYADRRFILDPTDLPVVIALEPRAGAPRLSVLRGRGEGDARIAGPLAALIGLVHGAYDGDALFFSRDLVIEGDTEAALALRNAVDDAELDLAREVETLSGPLARPLRRLIDLAERRTGAPLSRPDNGLYDDAGEMSQRTEMPQW